MTVEADSRGTNTATNRRLRGGNSVIYRPRRIESAAVSGVEAAQKQSREVVPVMQVLRTPACRRRADGMREALRHRAGPAARHAQLLSVGVVQRYLAAFSEPERGGARIRVARPRHAGSPRQCLSLLHEVISP